MYIKKKYYADYFLVKMIFPWRWDRIRLLTVFDLNWMGSVHRMPKLWGFYKEILKLMHCWHPPRLQTRAFDVKIYMPVFTPIRHQSSMGQKRVSVVLSEAVAHFFLCTVNGVMFPTCKCVSYRFQDIASVGYFLFHEWVLIQLSLLVPCRSHGPSAI
jgi:hypothetical protein